MTVRDTKHAARSEALLRKLSGDAVGLDATYTLATGQETRRIYLDSTASTLMLGVVRDALDRYLPYYSNTHSILHFGAKLSTTEFRWAHEMVLRFVNADPDIHTAFFAGSGTTAGINRVARTLREKRPERDVVITSIMEHHSNDLPHRKHFPQVVHVPAETSQRSIGRINMERLAEALEEHGERVNYVAITGVSNVTGIINPIHDIARLAHAKGAAIVVDAAQMAAHLPIRMSGNADPAEDLDIVVFSGHKIYAPGSPGVVITRKELFADVEPQEVGGGMVEDVYLNRHVTVKAFPDREEAGTPNISGAMGLAASLYALSKVGMGVIAEEERAIVEHTLELLGEIDDVILYGETDPKSCSRAGAVSFNLRRIHHGLTAAVLNDYFNISVRNHCFCAHPYVREMVTEELAAESEDVTDEEIERLAEMHRGMVRSSFGIYNTLEDVDALAHALREIAANRERFESLYDELPGGNFLHKTFRFDHAKAFSVQGAVDAWFDA